MPIALPAALFLFAQSAVAAPAANSPANAAPYGPAAPGTPPAAAPAKPPAAPAADNCGAPQTGASSREIVICAQRPNGYRLDPDVMAARLHKHQQLAGRPKTPMEKVTQNDCVVGPQGCFSAGINLIGAALTAAEMAERLSKGEEIGSMFKTEPQPDEYQLYVEAKHEREAKEAQQAALAKAKVRQAAADAAAAPATAPAATPAPSAPAASPAPLAQP
jgi:hypothetical protein